MKLLYLFPCIGEESTEISLDKAKLLVGLHVRTDPFGQLLNATTVGKPTDTDRELQYTSRYYNRLAEH